jgi:hypothetical protein
MIKLRAALLPLGLAGLFSMAADLPSPTNFGIKDDSQVPEDPRQAGRSGQFLDFPTWPVSKELPNDLFTFCRLRHNSQKSGRRRQGGGDWLTDYPDADLNFSYRLQQLTSLQVSPKGAVVDIDPEQMRHYPFIYMIEPGHITLTDEDAKTMRDYMMNGGFIMVDDFWGEEQWDNFYSAVKQIFPDREVQELPLEHEIFHMVFPLKVKPQIPSVNAAIEGRSQGITYEREDAKTPHYRAIFDDKKRIIMMICHNTDLGDGWEEEGTDPWYFREFSEKYAYPLGINIIFYALTH